ncbi:MAG: hypothetical protein WA977_01340 [Halobacteriota archaeon]
MKVKMWTNILTHLVAFASGLLSKVLFDEYKRRRDREEKLKEKTEKFKEDVSAKLNEFESIWIIETRGENKHPNTRSLKVKSEILGKQILEIVSKPPSGIIPDTLEKLKEIAAELIEMGDFLIQIDGGKSYNAFLEKGNNILDMIKEFKKELK